MIAAQTNDREIVFKLRMLADPRNAAEARKFSQSLPKNAPPAPFGGVIPPGRSATAPSNVLGGPLGQFFGGSSAQRIAEDQFGGSEAAKAAQKQTELHRKVAENQAKLLNKAEADQQRAADRAIAAAQRATDRKAAEDKRTADRGIAEAKRAAAAEEREEERLHRRHRQRQLERARLNRANRELELSEARQAGTKQAEIERGRDGRRAQYAATLGGGAGSGNRREALGRIGEGTMSLIGGVTALGLVGERNMDKFQDTALKVGGGIAVARGAMAIGSGAVGAIGAAPAAGIAAGVAIIPALAVLREAITGTAQDIDSLSMTIATAEVGMVNWVSKMVGYDMVGDVKTEKMQKARDADKEMQARKEAIGGIMSAAERERAGFRMETAPAEIESRLAMQFRMGSSRRKLSDVDKEPAGSDTAISRAANSEMTLVMQREQVIALTSARTAKTETERADAMERAREIQAKIVELGREGSRLARTEAEEKIRGARESISRVKEEIVERKKAMEDIQKGYMTSKEKFGELSGQEQQRALAAAVKLREANALLEKGGGRRNQFTAAGQRAFNSISKEDRELLKGLGLDSTGKQIQRGTLTNADQVRLADPLRDQIAALQQQRRKTEAELAKLQEREKGAEEGGSGYKNADRQKEIRQRQLQLLGIDRELKRSHEARAKQPRGGFDELIGLEERQKFAAEERVKKQMEVVLKDKRELIVRVEADYDEMARAAANAARVEIDRAHAQMEQKVQQNMDKGFKAISQQKTIVAGSRLAAGS